MRSQSAGVRAHMWQRHCHDRYSISLSNHDTGQLLCRSSSHFSARFHHFCSHCAVRWEQRCQRHMFRRLSIKSDQFMDSIRIYRNESEIFSAQIVPATSPFHLIAPRILFASATSDAGTKRKIAEQWNPLENSIHCSLAVCLRNNFSFCSPALLAIAFAIRA